MKTVRLFYNYFTMSVVLGRCDFRTIFILVICIFIRIILHKERTQFEQSIQREEYDTQCERITTRGDKCSSNQQPYDSMPSVFVEERTFQQTDPYTNPKRPVLVY